MGIGCREPVEVTTIYQDTYAKVGFLDFNPVLLLHMQKVTICTYVCLKYLMETKL